MKHVLALIAIVVAMTGASAFAGAPSGCANYSNTCWSQEQAGGCAGHIWGGLACHKSDDDGQHALNECWFKEFGCLDGCPSVHGEKCGQLLFDKLFLEILLVILFDLHQCPTHSYHC